MTLDRREFLTRSSLATSALFLPTWRRQRAGSAAAPLRFVFVIKSSGIDTANLALSGTTYAAERTETRVRALDGETLPEVLVPLRDHADKLTVLQGLSGANFKGNHTAGHGTLSCHNSELAPIAPSVDALLGLRCSTDAPYPMFGMATNGTLRGQQSVPDDSYVQPNLSAYGPGRAVPFQASPTKAWQELFGRIEKSNAELRRADQLADDLREFLEDGAAEVAARLPEAERERFAGYSESFAAIRRREQRKAALAERIAAHAPRFDEKRYASMQHMDRMAIQAELATAALAAGLTNVVTLRSDTLGAMYGPLGFGQLGVHAIGHGATLPDGTTSEAMRMQIDRWHMQLVAGIADRLAAVPESGGTMLDNTVIVLTSCAGGRHHGGNRDWPALLLGTAGGRLRSGSYVEYPSYGKPGHRGLACLWMSLLESAGIDYGDSFGQRDPGLDEAACQGPLAELVSTE